MDPDRLVKMVAETWPGLGDLGTVIVPQQGLDHAVVVFDSVVARRPLTDTYREQARVEARVVDQLADRTTVALPRPLRTTADGRLTLQRRVPGVPLDAQLWTNLPGDRRERVVAQLADFLTVLHTAEPAEGVVPWFRDGRPNDHPRSLPAKMDLLDARAAEALPDALDPAELDVARGILTDARSLLDPARATRPVHGDLAVGHVLVDDDRVGVIDLSDMNVGDPAVDFANLTDVADDLADRVLARYTGPADPGILDRAWLYHRWDSVFLLVDHLTTGRTDAAPARAMFAAAAEPTRPGAR